MAGEIICWVGDGSTPTSDERAKGVVRAIDAAAGPDVFVYGGDVYTDGTSTDYTNFNQIYGSTAPGASPAGADLRSTMYHTIGNHEYHTTNATTKKVDETDTYWTTHTATTLMGSPDNTKTDPNAAYSGLTATVAQQTAAAQWAHLKHRDVGGWRLLMIDAGRAGTDEGIFPTSGDYYDAVASLVNATSQRKLIVFCHFPRWSAGSSHGDRSPMNTLWALIAPKALALLGGHDHCVNRHQPRDASGTVVAQQSGCVQFVAGNGGTSLNTNTGGYTPTIDYGNDTTWGYMRITLAANSATFEYVSLGTDPANGSPSTLDTATLQADVPSGPQWSTRTGGVVAAGP
jgi:hypothetical protein